MNIFQQLPAGDSAAWLDDPVTLPDGRTATSAAWALRYWLRGPSPLDLVAAANGAGWKTTLSAAASAALTAGLYQWTATVSAGTERITVGAGQATITPDLTVVTGVFEARSAAQVALADCEAAMATFNKTGGKVRKYEIAGRTMEFQSIADLMTLHAFWRAKVLAEQSTQSIANGTGNTRNLYCRFVRQT
nr:hypothetical protein [uncultured Roseateles sp.]